MPCTCGFGEDLIAPTVAEIEEWLIYMSPGSLKSLAKRLRLTSTNFHRWNAREWERVMNYYVIVELGDERGYSRGRNV